MSPPDATKVTDATIRQLQSLIQDQRAAINDMLDVAKRLGPVVGELKSSSTAYDQAFESDTPPEPVGVSSSLQGFTLLFLGVSYLSLTLVLALYAYWFTQSIKNVGIVLGVALGVGLLLMGLLQRYG
jgi:hypothetical protein